MNAGDTAWMLICSALVLLMTPGLAFFYAGLVRERQVVNTLKMSIVALGLIGVTWALVGYSLTFSPGNSLIGGLSWVALEGVTTEPHASGIPHLAFMVFQMMFAIITPALISGAVVGRMRFRAYAAFIVAWSLLVYCPLAHWVWGPGGWIAAIGALDFAGGTVVHVSAGASALVAAIAIGPGRQEAPGRSDEPHNVPFVILGASLLWFGWFGFNAGSSLAADGVAVLAFVNTMLGAAAAVVVWVGIDMARRGKTPATGAAIGSIVGLVAITPAAGFVTPMAAMVIGGAGACVSYAAMAIVRRSRLDDTLDVFACHGVGGIVGSVLTGVFATTSVNPAGADGLLYGGHDLLGAQILSVVVAALFAIAGTTLILSVIRLATELRTSPNAEDLGIDLAEHAERAYMRDLSRTWLMEKAMPSTSVK